MSRQVRKTGLPYLRLGGPAGWHPLIEATAVDVTVAGTRLGVPGHQPLPDAEPMGSFGGRTLVRGTAIGPTGELLLADPARRRVLIRRQPASSGMAVDGSADTIEFTELWAPRPLPGGAADELGEPTFPPRDTYTLVQPVDVAFAPGGDLAIADAGAGRVLVLAYPNAALRRVFQLPGWKPVAVAFDPAGRCHVADAAGATVHRFDNKGRRDPGYPHPSTVFSRPWQLATVAPARVGALSPACGCGTDVLDPAVELAVLDGDRVLLLDSWGRSLSPQGLPAVLCPPALRRAGDSTLAWRDPTRPGHRSLHFAGMAVDRSGRHRETGLPLIAVARRVRLPQAGRLRLGPLRGDGPGFTWDRLVLEAEIPPGTELLVRTLSSEAELESALLDEPGAAWSRRLALRDRDRAELLVQSAPAARLWIDIEFRGSGSATPVLHRLDVHAPRRSSLHRLPPGYRQEAASADFLDRFLAYFDTVFTEVEAEHRGMAGLLDPRTAPAGTALDWLGSWFGLRFHPHWDIAARRGAISEAMAYATERGSVPGLRRLIRWHTRLPAPWPAIVEHFRVPADSEVSVGREPLAGPGVPHRCTIVLPASVAPDADSRQEIDRLLAEHMPAHVHYQVRYIRPGLVVGAQSSVGVDTLLGSVPAGRLGTGQLGIDAVAAGDPEQNFAEARRSLC